jgi:hypothetical protein
MYFSLEFEVEEVLENGANTLVCNSATIGLTTIPSAGLPIEQHFLHSLIRPAPL